MFISLSIFSKFFLFYPFISSFLSFIFRVLPVGTGEITAARKIKEDKINKSIQRRYAATAAIEREKQRRALTESDREKMRLELYEKDQPDKDTEESFLF